jgi:ribosomal protein S14
MKKIYIAGKVTGEDYKECYQKFAQAESAVVNLGAQPVNPMRINKKDEDWGRAMMNCLEALLGCDTMLLLPDWEESRGAKIEHDFAQAVGLKVIMHDTTPLIRQDSCQHKYPDGSSAIINACGLGFCQLCGCEDYYMENEKEEKVFVPAGEAQSTKCPICGFKHPLVAEFGLCGKCARTVYGTEH